MCGVCIVCLCVWCVVCLCVMCGCVSVCVLCVCVCVVCVYCMSVCVCLCICQCIVLPLTAIHANVDVEHFCTPKFKKNNIPLLNVGRTAKPHDVCYVTVTVQDCCVVLLNVILSSFQQSYHFIFRISVSLNCFIWNYFFFVCFLLIF